MTTHIADLELVELIGEGNHGTYWRARPPARLGTDDPWVRVKVLHARGGEEAFTRMVRELRTHASVASPHLVELLDAGHDRGRLYHVERDPGGGSLAAPEEEVGPDRIAAAVAGAARGAHALHEAGIAHRDITPHTVLLGRDGGGVLADLGLVQVLAEGMTATGTGPIGSLEFTDPVLLRGGRASRSSDIWSLGVVLHHALTGASIYPGLDELDLLDALRRILDEPPVLSTPPDGLGSVVGRCLASDPGDRFLTGVELADALEGRDA